MTRKLTIGLSCRNLPNKDRFSKSDPFVIVFSVSSSGAFKFVKRTEVKKVREELLGMFQIITLE